MRCTYRSIIFNKNYTMSFCKMSDHCIVYWVTDRNLWLLLLLFYVWGFVVYLLVNRVIMQYDLVLGGFFGFIMHFWWLNLIINLLPIMIKWSGSIYKLPRDNIVVFEVWNNIHKPYNKKIKKWGKEINLFFSWKHFPNTYIYIILISLK